MSSSIKFLQKFSFEKKNDKKLNKDKNNLNENNDTSAIETDDLTPKNSNSNVSICLNDVKIDYLKEEIQGEKNFNIMRKNSMDSMDSLSSRSSSFAKRRNSLLNSIDAPMANKWNSAPTSSASYSTASIDNSSHNSNHLQKDSILFAKSTSNNNASNGNSTHSNNSGSSINNSQQINDDAERFKSAFIAESHSRSSSKSDLHHISLQNLHRNSSSNILNVTNNGYGTLVDQDHYIQK